MITLRVGILKSAVGKFNAKFTHVETIGKGSEDLKSFGSDFFAFVGRKGGESANVVEAVGEFDDENANVGAEGNEEAKEVVSSFGKVSVEVTHAGTGLADFGDAVDEKGDGFAKFLLDVI